VTTAFNAANSLLLKGKKAKTIVEINLRNEDNQEWKEKKKDGGN